MTQELFNLKCLLPSPPPMIIVLAPDPSAAGAAAAAGARPSRPLQDAQMTDRARTDANA